MFISLCTEGVKRWGLLLHNLSQIILDTITKTIVVQFPGEGKKQHFFMAQLGHRVTIEVEKEGRGLKNSVKGCRCVPACKPPRNP